MTGNTPTAEADRAERAKQISDRLLEIAPYPERAEQVTAQGLARYLAVRASVINHQQLSPDAPFSRSQVDLLTVLFCAAHALYALDECGRGVADQVAREIWNAWEDGGGIGEWLWDHLGTATASRIGPLADDLATAEKPAGALLAHADPVRHALNRAAMEARSANHRDAYIKALSALEDELEHAREATA